MELKKIKVSLVIPFGIESVEGLFEVGFLSLQFGMTLQMSDLAGNPLKHPM